MSVELPNDKVVLSLALQDVEGRVITDARLELSLAGGTKVTSPRLNEQQGLFVSEPVDAGRYVLTVVAAGYVTENVPLLLTPPRVSTSVMLGRKGEPYYVVAGRRIYYPATNMMAALTRAPEAVAPIDRQRARPAIVTFPHAAAAARAMSDVMDAGPVVRTRGSDVHFLSREIEVMTEDGVTRERLDELVRPFGLHVTRQERLDPRLFAVAPEGMPGMDHGALPERLASLPEIREAHSQVTGLVRTLAGITPPDALFPLQFHSILTRLPEAWEKVRSPASAESYGSADIIVAVSDHGILTTTTPGDVPSANHPAFSGTVVGGTLTALIGSDKKLVDAFNFSDRAHLAPGNDGSTAIHGSLVCGVVSAAADANGVVGTAANTRLASYVVTHTLDDYFLQIFAYYAGINPRWQQTAAEEKFPFLLGSGAKVVPGAAIISASHTGPGTMNPVQEELLLRVTLFGRDRRGTVIIVAAGNMDEDLRHDGSWAENTNVIRVAATTLDVREEEGRMNYSNHSLLNDRVIDFSAPSRSHNTVDLNEPPVFYAITSAALMGSTGDLRGTVDARVNVTNAPAVGTTILKVAPADLSGFASGQRVIVRDRGNPLHAEIHELETPTGPDTINLGRGLGFGYASNTAEIIRLSGDNAYSTLFGGTSAAAPQASGIAALVLSVKPSLTWLEVRQIMRDTAVPVALRYRGSTHPAPPHYRYRWVTAANTDLIDGNGLLIIDGAGADRTISALVPAGTRFLTLNDTAGIAPRQALLIGAETKLSEVHPRHPATELRVDRNAGFETGDRIHIGRDVRTVLIRSVVTPDHSRLVHVQSVDGIEPNDFIKIGSERVQVLSIARFTVGSGDEATAANTGLNLATELTTDHFRGSIVTLADDHIEGPFTVTGKSGTNILNVDPPVTRNHPAGRMVWKEGTEVRAVIRLISSNQVEIDPVHNEHRLNSAGVENVRIGRIAHYGLGFGRGRLDALEAVEAAKRYTHDERDLMVRNFKDDDGKNNVAAQEVESFDLWVRNDAASPAETPYDECPHQAPEITVDPAIHIGTGRNDLQVDGPCSSADEVTFVIEIDHTDATDTFKWSRNGAVHATGVAITAGADQTLSDGVKIQFAAGTGHTLHDKWIVRARHIVARFAHIRIRNRGNQDFFTRSEFGTPPHVLDPGQRRLMLCISDGYPVARCVSIAETPGPNDLEVTGAYTGVGRPLFTIVITATAPTGDTFVWYRDGAEKPAVVIVAGMDHALEEGVTIRFRSHINHKKHDRWNLFARMGSDAFLNVDHYWDAGVQPEPGDEFEPSTGRAGTRVLFVEGISGLAAGASEIRSVAWPEAMRPPTNNPNTPRPLPPHPRRFFLLGETVPHDGALMGFTAKDNNNITFREIAFAMFRFSQDDGAAPLDTAVDVDNTGVATVKTFRVEVRTTCGTFRAEKVRLRFTGKKGAAPAETREFRHIGGLWKWNGTPPWGAASAPLEARRPDGSQPVATGEQFDLSFDCRVTLDKSFTEVIIEAEIVSEFRDHAVAAGKHTFTIFQIAPLPLGTGAAKAATLPKPSSFVFADMVPLSQTAQQTFGPVIDPADANATMNRYRATALFTAASEVKAYAVTKGLVAIQHNAADDTVNLFLRPLSQPLARLTPVKYFVYRGLKRSDWLKPADPKLIRDETGSPPFLASVWQSFKIQNPTVPDMPATVFGYDDVQPATELLDDIFFRVGATMQLPLAREGAELGTFDHSKSFGFEIVLEEGDYAPTLDYARKASYEIDITALPNGTPAEQFARRVKQEEILNFIDPAAFYGLHMHPGGVVRAPAGTHRGEEIYTNVVSRFLTKNQLYIDIRNENGSSLNFQRNYDAGGNQLQRGLTAAALTAQPYATSGWPIVSFDNNSSANTPESYNEIHLQLPRNDNENPVLYLAHGQLLAEADTPFLRDADLNDTGSWTKTVGFRVPNTGANPAKVAAAWILRLFYGRRDVLHRTVPIPNTVLKTTKYTDNVFGPIDRAPKWKGQQGIKWVTTQDNRYVDANTDRGWRQMMQAGLAVQTSGTPRVLLYAIATARDVEANAGIDFAPVRGVPSGVSDRKSFFSEPGLFGVYQLEIDQTQDGANVVRTLQLQQAPKDGYAPSSALLLGLTQPELDALLALGPGLDKFLRTLILDTKTAIADPNRPADRYRVGVQGLRSADGQYESVFPAAGHEIFVYSVDSQLFASKDFADAEPLPATYTRNYEEALGARDWPQRERQIGAVTTTVPKKITIRNYDWTDEVIPNSKIRIGKSAAQDGEKDVTAVQFDGTDTIITVNGTLNGTAPLGSAFTLKKRFEDRMVDLDQGPALNGIEKTRALVDGFITAVAAIANNAAAKAAIQARIDDEGVKILGRARARAQADRTNADDHERTLYWARTCLTIAVKRHPFCLGSISARNELLLRLEKKSRGYEPDFSGAGGGARKILLTGFDPFMLDTQLDRSNPSAAVALALHGTTISGASKSAFVQSAIFPVRYRDFDAGRVEELVAPRLSGAGKVDMIMSISQNGDSPFYDLERFAGRFRLGWYDNERVIQKPHALPTGNEFYETTLPAGVMVPGPFQTPPDDEQKLFFDQSFTSTTRSFRAASEASAPGENTNTPTGTLAGITGTALDGSGGSYLSNEIFYRIARERQKPPASTTLTGHLHVPSPTAAKVGIADVIAEVENLIKRWLDSLP